MKTTRLPIFESIAAVFAVATIAALTALPSTGQPQDMDQQLHDGLGNLRSAVFRYSMEHSRLEGTQWPSTQDFEAQLTGRSRSDGTTFEPTTGREDRWFGPYLPTLPTNPYNGMSSVFFLGTEQAPSPTGAYGWIYKESTGEIWAALPGMDSRGVLFAEY